MIKLFPDGIEISDVDYAALQNNLIDVEDWFRKAVDGKVNNCKKRIDAKAKAAFDADESVVTVPADADSRIGQFLALPDYEARVVGETDPLDERELSQVEVDDYIEASCPKLEIAVAVGKVVITAHPVNNQWVQVDFDFMVGNAVEKALTQAMYHLLVSKFNAQVIDAGSLWVRKIDAKAWADFINSIS